MRFGSVLGEDERGRLSTCLSSHGARLASWSPHPGAGRTYAGIRYDGTTPAAAVQAQFPDARVDDPAFVVLEIEPRDASARDRLLAALAGPAGPAGVVDAWDAGGSVVVEVDESRTPLALVVDLIDIELALGTPGRSIRPLVPLSDRTLTAFAGAVLATPDIDETRLIETYSEPLLRGMGS